MLTGCEPHLSQALRWGGCSTTLGPCDRRPAVQQTDIRGELHTAEREIPAENARWPGYGNGEGGNKVGTSSVSHEAARTGEPRRF